MDCKRFDVIDIRLYINARVYVRYVGHPDGT